MLAWPHPDTDWADFLDDAEACYLALAREILRREHLLILCRDPDHRRHIDHRLQQAGINTARLHFRELPYNDTWTRDYGPLAVLDNASLSLQDFRFNGWGGKFPAADDDRVNAALPWQVSLENRALVLEGGSVETDGRGTLLTTTHCLLNPNRNPSLDRARLGQQLTDALGLKRFVWLEHGALEGDDTDAHVDTLARFCNPDTVAYVQCRDQSDSHYPALRAMEEQLQREADRHGWRLAALPLPVPCFSDEGERLPATYANFLIINDAVLVPVYGVETDGEALDILAEVFHDREVVPVNCRVLIEQHGSLHCATMQLPQGVF